jgi:hypothetical protein
MGNPTDRSDSRGFGFGEFRPGVGQGLVWVDRRFDGVWWTLVGCYEDDNYVTGDDRE